MEQRQRELYERMLSRVERARTQLRAAPSAARTGLEERVSDAVTAYEAFLKLYAQDKKLALDRNLNLHLLDEIERLHIALDLTMTETQLPNDRWKQELAIIRLMEQIYMLLQRMQEKRLLCDYLLRRVDRVLKLTAENEGHTEAQIMIKSALEKLLGFLTPYTESKKTPLDRIAKDQQVADEIELVHCSLDEVLVKMGRYNAAESKQWVEEMQALRIAEQNELIQQLDTMALTEANGDAITALLAVFKIELLKNRQSHIQSDLDFMAKVYFRLYRSNRNLKSSVPPWFIDRADMIINYNEVIDEWQSIRILHGFWGQGTRVAIVAMTLGSERERSDMVNVVEVWFTLNHPHVLKLFGACNTGDPVLFVCEHIMDCSVSQYLAQPANKDKFWRVIYEAALALFYMHSQRTVHGCLQGRQIRMGADGKTKLCNFSSSFLCRVSAPLSPRAKSDAVRWMAPECLSGDDGGNPLFASDVYALGMCIIELASKDVPWGAHASDDDILNAVVQDQRIPDRPPLLDDAAWKLVARMCAFDHTERPRLAAVTDALGEFVRTETAAKLPQKKFCTNCGTQLESTANFCAQCGTRQNT